MMSTSQDGGAELRRGDCTLLRVLGFMTGTSVDAVDMAVIETDGHRLHSLGPAGEMKLSPQFRALIEGATEDALAWRDGPEPASFREARAAVAEAHIEAAKQFLQEHCIARSDLDLLSIHGQTVLHEPRSGSGGGRTIQLLDEQAVADELRLPVAHSFRVNDIEAGGEGAPLAPVYHAALAEHTALAKPLAILNLGGIANYTFISSDGTFTACDAGPANGMIDLLMQRRGNMRCDWGGRAAAKGQVVVPVLEGYLRHPFFAKTGPRSLDRFDFPLEPLLELSLNDAVATATAFAASSIALAFARQGGGSTAIIATGGGRHNPVLMDAINSRVPVQLMPAEAAGWRGDSVEAEAMAFLAARTLRDLPLSFPETTGVPRPLTGGAIAYPRHRGSGKLPASAQTCSRAQTG